VETESMMKAKSWSEDIVSPSRENLEQFIGIKCLENALELANLMEES